MQKARKCAEIRTPAPRGGAERAMQPGDSRLLCFEGFTLDLKRGCLCRQGDEIKLRPKSFELLCYLAENAGRLVAKDELIQVVWPSVVVADESLARCVSDVR